MDPISVAASVVGLLGAGAKISSAIMACVNHGRAIPYLAKSVIVEVNEISACLNQVQSFLLDSSAIPRSRQGLLMVEEVVVVLSNCVKIFSELEEEVDSLKPDQPLQPGRMIKWAWKEQTVSMLLQRMQSSKMSLNLMISTLTCNSITDAQASVNQLTSLVTDILKSNRDISQRLAQMEAQLSIRDSSSTRTPRQNIIKRSTSSIHTRPESVHTHSPDARQMVKLGFAFEEDLRKSRPYTRVRWRDDKWSSTSSAVQSTGPSFFSGLSLADISNLSVFNLVVFRSDLWNAGHYENPQPTPERRLRLPKSRLSDLFNRSHPTSDVAKIETPEPQRQKILLLGASLSGKSTIFRHLQLLHGLSFSSIERQIYRDIIIDNLVEAFNEIQGEVKLQLSPSAPEYQRFMAYSGDLTMATPSHSPFEYNYKMCYNALKSLWSLESVRLILLESQKSIITDRVLTYLEHIDELFMSPEQLNDNFFLGLRQITLGIYSQIFQPEANPFTIIDVSGERGRRMKWAFDACTSATEVIFVVSLAGYCESVSEDEDENQMVESMRLFDGITRHSGFSTCPFTILFNKIDVFSSRLRKTPVSAIFSDYQSENSSHAAMNYFEDLFRKRDRRSLSTKTAFPLEFHVTCAIDTEIFKTTIGQMQNFLTSDHIMHHDDTAIAKSRHYGHETIAKSEHYDDETIAESEHYDNEGIEVSDVLGLISVSKTVSAPRSIEDILTLPALPIAQRH